MSKRWLLSLTSLFVSPLYLSADHSDDDVLVVSAVPAQDVGALVVALLTQLVDGIIRTGDSKTQLMEAEIGF